MKKTKIILTMMITILLMLCGSLNVFALTEGDWEFKLLDDEVEITGYLGDDKNVVIPDTIYGRPVTSISGYNILPQAVSVTFPSTISTIPGYLFTTSYSGNHVLETVILPEGVKILKPNAFSSCAALKNIVLPSTITKIQGGSYVGAFQGCSSLEFINFPENLTEIGVHAFAFSGLNNVDLSKAINLKTIGYASFKDCEKLNKVILGNGVETIGHDAFWSCQSLASVVLPNSLKTIEGYSFNMCESLENIILPTSLKRLGDFSFGGCTSLKEVVIPYGVTDIGGGAFQSCPELRSVYIPDTVIRLNSFLSDSDNAIVYCTSESKTAEFCKNNKISYLTDNSVNSGITVLYNGTRISFHAYGQNPELLNSRTLVPLRSIFEAMGATVEWDADTNTAIAKRNGIEIKIQIGANEMYKNGKSIAVDVPAQLMNDRTMVPVRVIAEAFGADVQWNDCGRTVLITE